MKDEGATQMRGAGAALVVAICLLTAPIASAATPLTKCQVIDKSGSYILTGNITDPPGSGMTGFCILAVVPDVTIDLNGFAMIGTGPRRTGGLNRDTAIASGSDYAVTVLNGTITGFSAALEGEGYSRAEGLDVENCAQGGDVYGSEVSNSRFLNNTHAGLGGGALILGNIASGNGTPDVTGNFYWGIESGNGADVLFNTSVDNFGPNISTPTPCPNPSGNGMPACVEYENEAP